MDSAAKGVKEAVPQQPTLGEANEGASESARSVSSDYCCAFLQLHVSFCTLAWLIRCLMRCTRLTYMLCLQRRRRRRPTLMASPQRRRASRQLALVRRLAQCLLIASRIACVPALLQPVRQS